MARPMKWYLNSYTPLSHNRFGREACQVYHHPPFVDASCRREPDLESPYPSISALCRGRMFAPRLHEGDQVIYMTKKTPRGVRHLVAALEVIHRFETHRKAREWYSETGLPIPSNCLILGNPPLSIDHTDRSNDDVRRWDLGYHRRVRKHGTFLVCRTLAMDLNSPHAITDDQLISIFGRVPGTRTPPTIEKVQFDSLLSLFKD